MTIIPIGYRVTVTTWENDGDNYNTKCVEGLSKSAAEFIMKLCNLHGSSDDFGNMYEPDDDELEKYQNEIQYLIDHHDGEFPEYCETVEGVQQYLYNIGLSGSEFYTRVFETIKIEYVPVEIHIEDVTEQFTKILNKVL
jgi:hypothetical protein